MLFGLPQRTNLFSLPLIGQEEKERKKVRESEATSLRWQGEREVSWGHQLEVWLLTWPSRGYSLSPSVVSDMDEEWQKEQQLNDTFFRPFRVQDEKRKEKRKKIEIRVGGNHMCPDTVTCI